MIVLYIAALVATIGAIVLPGRKFLAVAVLIVVIAHLVEGLVK